VKLRTVCYAGLILLVVLAVAVRLRLLALPLERDEGEFAYNGQLILQGIPPFKLAFNMKMPGIYAAYAGHHGGAFGESPSGIHFGLLLVNLGTSHLLFLLARRLLDPAAVPVCCAAYVLLSLSPAVLGSKLMRPTWLCSARWAACCFYCAPGLPGQPLCFF
jgi:hypothetical protein